MLLLKFKKIWNRILGYVSTPCCFSPLFKHSFLKFINKYYSFSWYLISLYSNLFIWQNREIWSTKKFFKIEMYTFLYIFPLLRTQFWHVWQYLPLRTIQKYLTLYVMGKMQLIGHSTIIIIKQARQEKRY